MSYEVSACTVITFIHLIIIIIFFSFDSFSHIIIVTIIIIYCVLRIKALRADNARASPTEPVFGWRLRDINLEPVEGCGLRVFFLFFLRRSADTPYFARITTTHVNAQVAFFPCRIGDF
uniref:Uncharacterized protein n=1 Tax=Schizaphis graminum TaxID=13262 RepID=A0A2S2P422_SCHGA